MNSCIFCALILCYIGGIYLFYWVHRRLETEQLFIINNQPRNRIR